VGAGSGWEQSTVSLHTPTAQLDSAMALFADIALHPAFPTSDLERVRKIRLTSLQQLRDRGPSIADRAYATALYGERHPYGRPLAGTEASIAAISPVMLIVSPAYTIEVKRNFIRVGNAREPR